MIINYVRMYSQTLIILTCEDWAEWSGQSRFWVIKNVNISEPKTKLNNLEKSKC